jgi:hypothetical protein
LRRAGKTVHIICNTQNASEALLALADSYVDYRELVPGGIDEESGDKPIPALEDKSLSPKSTTIPPMSNEDWFRLLAEAADLMLKKKVSPGIGSVKIRMKMLNSNFNEKKLNFSHWSEFVAAAVKAGYVTIEGKGPEALVYPVPGVLEKANALQKAFNVLLDIIGELDKGSKTAYHSFRSVNSKLVEKKLHFNELGFSQFKQFIQAAEARGLVQSKVEGLKHSVRRTPANEKSE